MSNQDVRPDPGTPAPRKPGLTLLKAVLFLSLLAVPGLVISGIVVLASNPCFFRQFPPPGCPQSSMLTGSTGWLLIWGGIALLALIGLVAFIGKSASTKGK